MTWRQIFRKNIATFCLMAGMFFNPLGFDIIFKMMLDVTSSDWITTGIFYGIALSFFGLYFLFREKNEH